jgi:hypothetical protein
MPKYTEMPPGEIKVARFNPARRIDRNSLTGLLLSIRQHGILEPLAIASDLTLADGHRRLAAAKLLDLPNVPVAIYKETALSAPSLWVVLNSETMNLTPAQWLAAVDAGLPLDTPGFPDPLKRRIEQLVTLIGKEGMSRLVEQGRSPLIIDSAIRIANYCGRRADDGFFKSAVLWLVEVGNAFSVKAAIGEGIPADLLEEAVSQGHELMRVWDIARE